MRALRVLLPLLIVSVLALAPVPASAATANFFGPIISPECECEESAPDFGCVLQTIQNTINVAISLGVIFAVLVIAYGGLLLILSPFNTHNREVARTMLLNAVIGLAIALSSWLLVDFVMKTLYNDNSGFGPWNTILGEEARACLEVKAAPIATGQGEDNLGTTTVIVGGGTSCTDCVAISPPLTCKSASSCTLASSVASKFKGITFSGSWRVTEAYPPTATHRASCHRNGTCIDAGFTGNTTYTTDTIEAFSNAAKAQGLCVVFETTSNTLRDQAIARGVVAHAKSEDAYKHITGNHFSVYSNTANCR